MKLNPTLTILFLLSAFVASAQYASPIPCAIDPGQGAGHIRLYPAAPTMVIARTTAPGPALTGVEAALPFSARMFPDPVAGRLNLSLQSTTDGTLQVEIHDMAGSSVFSSYYAIKGEFETQLNTTSFPDGLYLVTLSCVSSTGAKNVPITRIIHVLNRS